MPFIVQNTLNVASWCIFGDWKRKKLSTLLKKWYCLSFNLLKIILNSIHDCFRVLKSFQIPKHELGTPFPVISEKFELISAIFQNQDSLWKFKFCHENFEGTFVWPPFDCPSRRLWNPGTRMTSFKPFSNSFSTFYTTY